MCTPFDLDSPENRRMISMALVSEGAEDIKENYKNRLGLQA